MTQIHHRAEFCIDVELVPETFEFRFPNFCRPVFMRGSTDFPRFESLRRDGTIKMEFLSNKVRLSTFCFLFFLFIHQYITRNLIGS